jgi:arsenate reductase (thioredoxin)
VCDNAAAEACPIWPGHPVTAHWGFADPAALHGSDEEKRAKFREVYESILARIRQFMSLPSSAFEPGAIRENIRALGREPG